LIGHLGRNEDVMTRNVLKLLFRKIARCCSQSEKVPIAMFFAEIEKFCTVNARFSYE
jgi:hypothetical protein